MVKRRTMQELFLDKLTQLTGNKQELITNERLKKALGWDDEKYTRIRKELNANRSIVVGVGYGGKVGLNQLNSKALSLFISYSHTDESFKNDLEKHLDPLKRLNLIDIWHDGKIQAGQEINTEILKNLSNADIILMLVSIDFLNSYFCIEVEMEKALERHDKGIARVIPIILRSCMWESMPFQNLKALPKDAKAVNTWTDRDEALTSIAKDLRAVAEELLDAS